MSKSVHPDVLDATLDVVDQGNLMTLCSAEPTTRTEAVATFALADVAMTPNVDYTKQAGDNGSGRQVRMAAKSGVPVDVNGTGTHIALVDGTRLLLVTTCTSQAVTTADSLSFPAWDFEVDGPLNL